jgi:alkanesulfonate monooxygenase SsuD/methylene tetrahydromethanopterin reductase-like flavin-dependent oxidoreductase (luciferase family)
MKLGIISMWGEDYGQFRDQIRLAEELELSLIGLGDSPVGWHELYVSLTVAAMETKHATVAPMVTTPIGRHPAVAAGAMSSLHDLTGGRVAFAIGTGGSMVKGLGRGLATQAEITPYLKAMRALFAGESIEWDGSRVTPLSFARPVPVYYSATGPKALALAGELADGVVLTVGSSMRSPRSAPEPRRRAAIRRASTSGPTASVRCAIRGRKRWPTSHPSSPPPPRTSSRTNISSTGCPKTSSRRCSRSSAAMT